jgi:hypothetical protein
MPIPEPTHFNPEDGIACCTESLVSTHKTAQCHNPEDHSLNDHCPENFKTYIIKQSKNLSTCILITHYHAFKVVDMIPSEF